MKILVVEDDPIISEAIKDFLTEKGYKAYQVFCGDDAWDMLLDKTFDLIIMDIMLPNIDGLELIKLIRDSKMGTRILCLSALSDTEDKVKGLSLGADDYLVKPFSLEELEFRIIALFRRSEIYIEKINTIGDWTYYNEKKYICKDEERILFTDKENMLFQLLLTNKNNFLTKQFLLERVWPNTDEIKERHLIVQISLLRKKLEHPYINFSIINKKGIGYTLEEKKN